MSDIEAHLGEDGYETLIHEIGHALGLKHPQQYVNGGHVTAPFLISDKDNSQYTVMSYNTHPYVDTENYQVYTNSGASSAKTPLLYDVSAMQSLYGANTSYHSTNTIYQWDTNVDPYMTIWDSGGIDTIDVSNQAFDQRIDLRSGEFSSVGAVKIQYTGGDTEFISPEYNLSIAYNSIIENAIGSPQNDLIFGNSVNNELTGNRGEDKFVFASQLSSNNIDTITDFNPLEDIICLDKSIFTSLQADENGHLLATELLVTSNQNSANSANQHLIFDTLSHTLYYDSDGINGSTSIAFAKLPTMSNDLNISQFLVF